MRRYFIVFVAALAFTGIACPPAPKDDPVKTKDEKPSAKLPPLENMEQLRPRIEAALQQVRERDLRAEHGFWTVFHAILGTGLEKTKLREPKTKSYVNAIDYICDGNELPGLKFIPTKHGLDVETVVPMINDRLQFIAQGHQDQFIAEMAQWGMKPERQFKVGGKDYSFQDFINHSTMRASVTKQQELSWAIIIIGQFHGTTYQWKNGDGEDVRFDQVVQYELDQSIERAACGGTHRLFGLTWAYHLHLQKGGKKEGVWLAVEKKIADYKQTAKKLQKPDGTFSLKYFETEVANELPPGDRTELQISTTGHIVEWLALAMTDEELRSPWMQNAVNGLVISILDMGPKDIDGGALYHAAHGLHIYHERVFGTPATFLALPPRK
jgi:hypothetical protein